MSEPQARKAKTPSNPEDGLSKSVNPEMMALARESRDLSQTDLAELLGVTQGKVSKYEAGLLSVTDADLERLVSVLEYPKEFFFETGSAEGFGTNCWHHRKRQSLPVKELRSIHATINVLRIQLAHLLSGTDIETHNDFFRMDVDEYGTPENVARLVRSSWKLPIGPIRNLVNAIENAGGIVFHYPFGTDKIDAVTQYPRLSAPLFFINNAIPVDRWRFSLAHELGHIIMHKIPTPNAEKEADRFAAEFLMPERQIADELEGMSIALAARLKPRWRVSIQALIRRACELGKITTRKYQSLCVQINALGYRKNEPVELPPENPSVLRDIIQVHEKEFHYDISQMSALTNCCEKHFRRFFLCDSRPRLRIMQ
jgi:Zn-dependent peptidase ImmA (M78 family)/transcriptional regulator with XRE-family HTH domain